MRTNTVKPLILASIIVSVFYTATYSHPLKLALPATTQCAVLHAVVVPAPFSAFSPSIPVAHCHWQLKCTDLLDLEATEVIFFQSLQPAVQGRHCNRAVVYCACVLVFILASTKISDYSRNANIANIKCFTVLRKFALSENYPLCDIPWLNISFRPTTAHRLHHPMHLWLNIVTLTSRVWMICRSTTSSSMASRILR